MSLAQILAQTLACYIRRRPILFFKYCYATDFIEKTLRVLERMGLIRAQQIDYSWEEVVGPDGSLLIQRALEQHSLSICQEVLTDVLDNNIVISEFCRRFSREKVMLYLQKEIHEDIKNTLTQINIAAWFKRTNGHEDSVSVKLFVPRNRWVKYIRNYSAEYGVEINLYRDFSWKLPFDCRKVFSIIRRVFPYVVKGVLFRATNVKDTSGSRAGFSNLRNPITVAAPYWGRGATLDQSKSSDLFWVPFSKLSPDQLLIYGIRSDEPIDDDEYKYLRDCSIRVTSVSRSVSASNLVPKWPSEKDLRQLIVESKGLVQFLLVHCVRAIMSFGFNRWLSKHLLRFTLSYIYWRWFFNSHNVKLLIDHVDWPKSRLAADQALTDIGGVSVSYQRSFEALPTIVRASSVDVHFAFSTEWVNSEYMSKSAIPQYVANGYAHDYAIPHVKGRSQVLRRQLEDSGAKFIICLLDENSVDDKRVGPSHEMRAENYRFLLQKVLEDNSLGLVIKPKKPADLRERLGDVSSLLEEVLKTGRCHLFQYGVVSTDILPAEASLAADVTIGLLYGSTAALESALAGTPTLLIDRECVTYHPLYNLGIDKVVFRNWDTMWDAISKYRSNPDSVSGFGDWDPMLDSLDPFRDGKAGQRMGKYIGCLADGLSEGLDRYTALELAAKRYSDEWGKDKITSLGLM